MKIAEKKSGPIEFSIFSSLLFFLLHKQFHWMFNYAHKTKKRGFQFINLIAFSLFLSNVFSGCFGHLIVFTRAEKETSSWEPLRGKSNITIPLLRWSLRAANRKFVCFNRNYTIIKVTNSNRGQRTRNESNDAGHRRGRKVRDIRKKYNLRRLSLGSKFRTNSDDKW